ncbi:hypothetical protein X798_02119 [Onchocerca flexuosa]|uniref:Uncharacterized protein n=1 Tax=Onchocerca flexuosa TaxID=387005 RepID=A0A238BZJ7_9BILA|nr:hypothetical protein X798_02119 [Onchocerca flexuosa]
MYKITLLVALIITDACCPFYMIARPGGIFKLRNNMHSNLRHYSGRTKKALLLNDPTYLKNLYNHDYRLIPIQLSVMDYSADERNEQGKPKVSVPAIPLNNGGRYDGKNMHPIDITQEIF